MPSIQKRPRKRRPQPQSRQPYDNALKALMEDHAVEVIPEFIPEAAVVIEQNNEIKRENLRADLVYLIHYRNQLHVLDMELQRIRIVTCLLACCVIMSSCTLPIHCR